MTTISTSHATPFYIGTYTGEKSEGIYLCDLDAETGHLGPVTLAAETKNPSFIALTPNNQLLFSVSETSEGEVREFVVKEDGSLTFFGAAPSGGADPCHVSISASGRHVFAANYSSGNVSAFLTSKKDWLGQCDSAQLTGSGPNKERQDKPHAHSIYPSEDGRFVYVCDLGSDKIWIFNFEKGKLTPAEVPFAEVPPGSGPRHMAFRVYRTYAYVVNEMGCSVTVFKRNWNNGALTPLQTVSALGEGTTLKSDYTAAAIAIHPNDRWLYASIRGLNAFAIFSMGQDGKLTFVAQTPTVVRQPRDFAIDPTGKWLVVAGQQENKIAVFKIDPANGTLTPTDQIADVGSPVCILFSVPAKTH
jgi:6-phosphogluconolactonase